MNSEIPKNLEAEKALLSCLCVEGNSNAYDSIASALKQDDFYDYKYGLVFKAIGSLASKGEAIDLISLCEELKTSGDLEQIGNAVDVMAITDGAQTSVSTKYFAKIVKEKSKLREIIKSFRIGLEEATAESKTSEEISGKVQSILLELDVGSDDKTPVTTSVNDLRSEFQQRLDGTYTKSAVETHIGH